MNQDNPVNDIPMRVSAFKVESKGKTNTVVVAREIPDELVDAKTFPEIYLILAKMKMNLMATGVFEDVEMTMDTVPYSSPRDLDVLVRVNLKEARPLRIGLQGSVTTTGNDAGIEGTITYLNALGLADSANASLRYDVLHKNTYYTVDYNLPKFLNNYSVNVRYEKEMRNMVKESSVNTFSEGLTAVVTSSSNRLQLGYSFTWRDMAPTKDIDVERILNQHCSKPMLKECHPSVKSTLFSTLVYDSRNNSVLATSGIFARLRASYSGLLGDVHQVKVEGTYNANCSITPMILGEPGLALHLSSYGGWIRNLNRRGTRYFDRFFLSGEHIRGYEMADIGPRSRPEDGGRKEGDVLGGDRCVSLGASLSFPLILSTSGSGGIRGHFFYNIGNVWNHTTHLKKVYKTAKENYGVGVMIPFGSVGRLEVNYSFLQKRFSFLFCAM